MEEKRAWPPVRRKKKMPLLYKYWPPIRLGLIAIALIAFACLLITRCSNVTDQSNLSGGTSETTETSAATVETVPSEEEVRKMADELMKKAEFVAAGYDYSKATQMLEAFEYYDQVPELAEAVSQYAQLDAQLVSYPNMYEVTHVFFHSLIVDPERAFDNESTNGGYNQHMTTIDEFVVMPS